MGSRTNTKTAGTNAKSFLNLPNHHLLLFEYLGMKKSTIIQIYIYNKRQELVCLVFLHTIFHSLWTVGIPEKKNEIGLWRQCAQWFTQWASIDVMQKKKISLFLESPINFPHHGYQLCFITFPNHRWFKMTLVIIETKSCLLYMGKLKLREVGKTVWYHSPSWHITIELKSPHS